MPKIIHMELLIHFLHAVHPMSAALEAHLRVILKIRLFKKNDFLLKAGHTCSNVYFIEQGLFRCYHQRKDNDICNWFMKEGDVMFEVRSFYTQTTSHEFIQALEDCIVYYISYSELKNIYRQFIEFNVHRAILTERYYLQSEERNFVLREYKSKDRYLFFRNKHPELLSRLPAKDIASHIGVSQATMTRLRSHRHQTNIGQIPAKKAGIKRK